MYIIIGIVLSVFLLRLFFLKISIKNEKNILKNGGKEYGVKNSKYITILHILFYIFCIIEAVINNIYLDNMGKIGIGLIIFSMCMLYMVVRLLGEIWTVKLMILKNHQFVDHWIFRTVKHPNYFLNIFPELLGLVLLCHAKYTALVLAPLYVFVLYRRIKEERKLIDEIIIPNGIVTK